MINDENTTQPESSNASSVKETVRETKDKLKTKASEVAGQVRSRGEEYLQSSKERTANRIESYSESIRHVAEKFEQEEDPNLAHYTGLIADKLERAAGYVRDHDLRAVQHDVEDLARRHPAIFFGGMFVAGLAAARFLKASAERAESMSRESYDEDEGPSYAEQGESSSSGPYAAGFASSNPSPSQAGQSGDASGCGCGTGGSV